MINDLDETLKELLRKKAGFDPADVDISFDTPTRDWSTPVTRPTVNLYLYDVHENTELRDPQWVEHVRDNKQVGRKRPPRRIDLAYMITCWTSAVEDQHRLLWRVLDTFMKNSPLPDEVMQGALKNMIYPAQTKVAQPDGILKNPSDFWGALENQIRPAISLLVTLELDLDQVLTAPIVFTPVIKFGERPVTRDLRGVDHFIEELKPGWEGQILQMGGVVTDHSGVPIKDAAVRLVGKEPDGRAAQFGPTLQTDVTGHYVFRNIPPGQYTLVVEVAGQPPRQQPLTVEVRERGELLPELVHQVEVPMK